MGLKRKTNGKRIMTMGTIIYTIAIKKIPIAMITETIGIKEKT